MRTVRSECTDRLLILNERHLGRVLVRYVRHYDGHRPHRALKLRPPDPLTARIPSTPAALASIRRREILGALINEYHAA
ncbi:MAG: transposase [Actinomycetota bacterium]|nr:transposase [Actinomycetota bacterium]